VKTIDVMLDLESLGTTPGSVVLSIGAASTDPTHSDFYEKLNVLEQVYLGLTINPDTMSWWRKQDKEAWLSSVGGQESLGLSLLRFAMWLRELRAGDATQKTGNKIRIWGDGAIMDCCLLAYVFRAANVVVPWDYREEFCYRTVRTLANSEKPRAKLQHNALDDAQAQLVHLQELLAEPEGVDPRVAELEQQITILKNELRYQAGMPMEQGVLGGHIAISGG
jgi:hypothetical protein